MQKDIYQWYQKTQFRWTLFKNGLAVFHLFRTPPVVKAWRAFEDQNVYNEELWNLSWFDIEDAKKYVEEYAENYEVFATTAD